ncbi:WD40 repeat [Macleaya cordata]|uniref:WD40 repeat n=1 Tax=Macleaya cordata TaxID=56857 RepID=A0A200QY34_MACCD|nr:WD40 repeat [Macleaya cordata]
MPRTIAVECPGCPPIRALTFDVLGLIKVIEGRGGGGDQQATTTTPKVVERWGEPDSSRTVLAASINDRKSDPLLAVARKNGRIEVLNPLNGELRVAEKTEVGGDDDPITGLHLFKRERFELSSRSCTLITCTVKGNAILRSLEIADSLTDSKCTDSRKTWNVCAAGNILCSAVDGNENYALFGGKGVELNVWDLETCSKTWNAKSPPKNSLDIFTPTCFTAATFLCKDDHRKIVAGTNSHQVRLYDISAQRRPVISFDFRESAIKTVAEDLDGHTIYLGTGSGDLASVDMRTGKLLGCFLGKCSGSIRSIVRHPEFPVIASCGLDRYLRFWDINTRQLLSAVFLKQHLTKVVIDSNFSDKETTAAAVGPPKEMHEEKQMLVEEEDDEEDASVPVKRKKAARESEQSKKVKAKKKKEKRVRHDDEDDEEKQMLVEEDVDDASMPVKRKKANRENEQSKKLKSKKKKEKQVQHEDEGDEETQTLVEEDDDKASMPVKSKKASRESEQSKKLKPKKKKVKRIQHKDEDDES